jgi:hypothetical protein
VVVSVSQFVHIFQVVIIWAWGGVIGTNKKILAVVAIVNVNHDYVVVVVAVLITVVFVTLVMNFLAFRNCVLQHEFLGCKS